MYSLAPMFIPARSLPPDTFRAERQVVVEEALKADEGKKLISEDDRKRLETEVQKLTDEIVKAADEVSSAKEKEILGR